MMFVSGAVQTWAICYDCPAGDWVHLRMTNPVESAFATVRLRRKVIKGHGPQAAGLAMASR